MQSREKYYFAVSAASSAPTAESAAARFHFRRTNRSYDLDLICNRAVIRRERPTELAAGNSRFVKAAWNGHARNAGETNLKNLKVCNDAGQCARAHAGPP
jgi:hypothetical protein